MVFPETSPGETEMMPVHELLNRIRWDAGFAEADFKIGYYDRIEDRKIPLLPAGNKIVA